MDLVIYLLPLLDIQTRGKFDRPALCTTVGLRKLDFTSIQPRLILTYKLKQSSRPNRPSNLYSFEYGREHPSIQQSMKP